MKKKILNIVTSNLNLIRYIIIGVIIFIALILVYLLLTIFSERTGTICLIRGIIGIPCPSCGITRALKSLLGLDIKMAFYYHPLFWVPFIIGVIAIVRRKYIKVTAIVSIVLLMVVYIIRMAIYFPYVEPMQYNNDSLIEQLI